MAEEQEVIREEERKLAEDQGIRIRKKTEERRTSSGRDGRGHSAA
jgi:hypothetical protein